MSGWLRVVVACLACARPCHLAVHVVDRGVTTHVRLTTDPVAGPGDCGCAYRPVSTRPARRRRCGRDPGDLSFDAPRRKSFGRLHEREQDQRVGGAVGSVLFSRIATTISTADQWRMASESKPLIRLDGAEWSLPGRRTVCGAFGRTGDRGVHFVGFSGNPVSAPLDR